MNTLEILWTTIGTGFEEKLARKRNIAAKYVKWTDSHSRPQTFEKRKQKSEKVSSL